MSPFGALILTTSIALSSASNGAQNDEKTALIALGKATYIKSGLNVHVKNLEKRYISKEMREYGGWIAVIGKTIGEKKISIEWTF